MNCHRLGLVFLSSAASALLAPVLYAQGSQIPGSVIVIPPPGAPAGSGSGAQQTIQFVRLNLGPNINSK
ncbi:MAG TPA: hypothetical protein VFD13_05350, partial [Candidatus Kapabacteria bacterium]|nr:hypothetical protein [Candidatus Kapabacteria bacterium]